MGASKSGSNAHTRAGGAKRPQRFGHFLRSIPEQVSVSFFRPWRLRANFAQLAGLAANGRRLVSCVDCAMKNKGFRFIKTGGSSHVCLFHE